MVLRTLMTVEEHFIHDKIAIPASSARTSRRRLLALLAENLGSANATILNGRAGTGKTTLVADFARHAGRATAWYKVDAVDNDLRFFCEYLSASIRLQRPSIDTHRLLELTDTIENDRADLLADAFVCQLADHRPDPLLIVIEDLHLVYDADWVIPFFSRFLALLPTDVHVVVTCRSMPPTPLWRLRSKQMLRVVEETELAFTLDEAVALFETYGLSEEHARIAWNQTNGRASTIAEFAGTPGRAGRAVADNILSFRHPRFPSLRPTPDFQT